MLFRLGQDLTERGHAQVRKMTATNARVLFITVLSENADIFAATPLG